PDRDAAPPAPGPHDDAPMLFRRLVERYRAIETYHDVTRVVKVTRRPGERRQRVETELACDVQGDTLDITTPSSQTRSLLGLRLPVEPAPSTDEMRRRYQLWLAPHLALKFARAPLESMQPGTDGPLTATESGPVTIGDRAMVHLGLTAPAAGGSGLVHLDLFIDPASMLIERIEGRQRLPGGGSEETTVDIAPSVVIPSSPACPGPEAAVSS
ncbi:MAG: hypothetical protein ACYTG1_06335, partial [Planctomycetota bacterium]